MLSRMHLTPTEVWGLDVDQWVVVATSLDTAERIEREQMAKLRERAG